ncbi:MAG: hypothetical protein AAFN91_17620 [Pseudomonadota bacterium]
MGARSANKLASANQKKHLQVFLQTIAVMQVLPDRDRLTLAEIADYMRLSKDTIRRRIGRGTFPKPIDKGRELIFCRNQVLNAIEVPNQAEIESEEVEDALIRAAGALPNRRTRKIPAMEAAKRRKRARSLDRSGTKATLRVVADNPGL